MKLLIKNYLIKINGQEKPIEVFTEDARNIIEQINDGKEFIKIGFSLYRASEIMSISHITQKEEVILLAKMGLIPASFEPDCFMKPTEDDELKLCEFYGNYCFELNALS